ncbi:MAG: DJ-1/PfpI family protein [Treponema sp.]|jgi:4-methyl-5(b-hydroxyethyl)-thiazole monophosphate biosynthesis|nr:DJ-1/PfpI family protein [Treponema sp.]
MKTAVVFLASGFEEVEALSPVDYLRRAQVDLKTVKIPDDSETLRVKSSHGVPVIADCSLAEYLSDTDRGLPDAIIIPGGMPGSENLGKCTLLVDFIKKIYAAHKLVCAICAAPIVVVAQTGLLADHKYTCNPGWETKLEKYIPDTEERDRCMAGSILERGTQIVVDGHLITACGAGAAEEFSLEIIKHLCDGETVSNIKLHTCMR